METGSIFLIIVLVILSCLIAFFIKDYLQTSKSYRHECKIRNSLYEFFASKIDDFYYVPSESTDNYKYFYLNDKFGNPRYLAFIIVRTRNCAIFVAPNKDSHDTKNQIVSIFEKEQNEILFNSLMKKIN